MPHEHSHHDHAHSHSHAPAHFGRMFAIGIVLNTGFVIVEAIYAGVADSMALLADAGHNLSDVFGLALAWLAFWLSQRLPTARRTYGLQRSSILAALFNAILLLLAAGGIAWETLRRIMQPEPVAENVVMVVAGVGIVVNGITALLFMQGGKEDLNVRGAFLHMAADAIVSLGVVLSALLIQYTGWLWIDPLVSMAIVVVIIYGTWGLLRESLDLALDAVPRGIHPGEVEDYLAALPGVDAVHDLHIWGMSTTEAALTVHLVKPNATLDDALLAQIRRELHDRFGIEHCTVQFELGDPSHPCHQAPATVV